MHVSHPGLTYNAKPLAEGRTHQALRQNYAELMKEWNITGQIQSPQGPIDLHNNFEKADEVAKAIAESKAHGKPLRKQTLLKAGQIKAEIRQQAKHKQAAQ